MARRMRRPETARLEISDGDWLLVKKHLTAGETRAMFGRMLHVLRDGINPTRARLARAVSYLVDWSITDANGKPVVIADQPEDAVESALDALDFDSFVEICDAIETHMAAMEKERAQEKNARAGESASSAISPSPS